MRTRESKRTPSGTFLVNAATPATRPIRSSAYAWGNNYYGQLGDGTLENRSGPILVPGIDHIRQGAGTENGSLALRSDGTVWAWGSNAYGQLGLGYNQGPFPAPTQVPNLSRVTQIVAFFLHGFAITADGSLWAWGNNGAGV